MGKSKVLLALWAKKWQLAATFVAVLPLAKIRKFVVTPGNAAPVFLCGCARLNVGRRYRQSPEMTTPKSLSLPQRSVIQSCGIVFMTIVLLVCHLLYCRHGFDITDEAYYIISIKSPFLYNMGVSQYQFIYYPLFKALGEDIFLLRIISLLFTYLLSCLLAFLILSPFLQRYQRKYVIVILVFALASLSLMQFQHIGERLATPSYNTLNFQAILIATIGLLLAHNQDTFKIGLGCVLIGIGCTLCFLAKPPSALLLVVCLFCYNGWTKKICGKFVGFSILVSCITLLIFIFVIDGSIYAFIEKYRVSWHDTLALAGGHDLQSCIMRYFSFPRFSRFLNGLFIVALLGYGLYAQTSDKQCTVFVGATCLFSIILLAFSGYLPDQILYPRQFYFSLAVLEVTAFIVIYVFLSEKKMLMPGIASHVPLALFLFAMPFVYVFGTDVNYYSVISKTTFFMFLAVVVLFQALPQEVFFRSLFPCVVVLLFLAIQATANGKQHPYRQDAALQDQQTTVNVGGSTLQLSAEFAGFIEEIRRKAQQVGLEAGTPVIDLTGLSPGSLALLEVEAVGAPWIMQGHKDVLALATRILQRVPREKLRRSWVLLEPGGPRAIPEEIFARLSLNFPEDYEKRAKWRLPKGIGEEDPRKPRHVQYLYAPRKNDAVARALR